MIHSSFKDIYKDRVFVITFYSCEKGFTIKIKIDGFPELEDKDGMWPDREDAKVAGMNAARAFIDGK